MQPFDRHSVMAVLLVGVIFVAPGLAGVGSQCHDKATPEAVSHAQQLHGSHHDVPPDGTGVRSPRLGTCCVDPQAGSAVPAILPAQPDTRGQGAAGDLAASSPRDLAHPLLSHPVTFRPNESPPLSPRSKNILNSVFLI